MARLISGLKILRSSRRGVNGPGESNGPIRWMVGSEIRGTAHAGPGDPGAVRDNAALCSRLLFVPLKLVIEIGEELARSTISVVLTKNGLSPYERGYRCEKSLLSSALGLKL